MGEEEERKARKAPLPKPSPAQTESITASPRAASPAESQGKKIPSAGTKAEGQDTKNPAAAKIGGELESLEHTMKGPLDALIESEALGANPFDDPAAGLQLNPAVPKKFKLRRFLKNLFRRNKSKVVRVTAADPRQVKLVLFSWGVGIVLVIGLLAIFKALSPAGSAELRQKADDAAQKEDYQQAIASYDEYLKHYANLPDAKNVRLSRGLAELQLAEKQATASGDWTAAFEVARTQVKALPKDYTDTDAMQKFSFVLAKIGEGLAQQAQGHPGRDALDRLQSVVTMLETDIPENSRPADAMIEGIKRILKQVDQDVEGSRELSQTVEAIHAAVEADKVQAAYAAYRDLVHAYPELTNDVRLTDAMKQVSAIEQKVVQPVTQSLAAVQQERPSGLLAAMPLAVQPVSGELAAGLGKRLFVVEQGTAYGLNAATGKVLWRRFVAWDPKLPAVTALPIAGPADGDVVLCDPVHQELLRVQGATGQVLWRLAVGRAIIAEPVRAGNWLLLLTKDQRLTLIDLASGNSPRYVPLPQAVRLPPVVDADHGLIFLAAEHSNLIVLDMNHLDAALCRQVLHVGHQAGKIAASPAVVGDFLLLPVNDTPGEATIRVFSISKDKASEPLRTVQTIRVAGSIETAPVAAGRGAAVVTAQGGLFAFDRNEADHRVPFQVVASSPAARTEKATHYAVSSGGMLWVADTDLTRYAVQADEHRLVSQEISDVGMKFVRAPLIDGGTMFQVLQRPGMPGLTVSAFDLKKGEAVWQTWLAAPLVAEPMLGPVSHKLTAITASGGMFLGPQQGLKPGEKPWEPVLAIDSNRLTKPICSLLPLPGEMYAMTSGADTRQIAVYDPQEQDKQFRWLLSPQKIAVGPGAFAGGLLTACINGQVFLLDREAQGNMAKPLEPVVKGIKTWNWQTPVGVDDKLAVLSDGDKRLMAIGITTDAEKALSETAAAPGEITRKGLVSPIAVLGNVAFVVDAADNLLSFALPNLTPGTSQSLGAHCVWGPQRVGKLVLVATEKDRLFAVGEGPGIPGAPGVPGASGAPGAPQVVWQSVLRYGPLAGAPYLSGDEIFLSARSGAVWRISAADGKELGKIDAGCPLGTGPLVVGSRVIVGGHEGSLLEVKKP